MEEKKLLAGQEITKHFLSDFEYLAQIMFEVVSSQFFLRSESGHEFNWLPAKRTGLGLADPSGGKPLEFMP